MGNNYQILKQLGQGGWGSVVEAVHLPSGTKVAIKRVKEVFENRLKATRMLREIILLRKLNNSRFVKIFDLIEPVSYEPKKFDTLYIVLELAESDMRKLIKSEAYLSLEQVRKVMYDLLCAIKYMHSASVLHRDLKPGNILLSKNMEVKICDFGLARSVAGLKSTFHMVHGSKKRKNTDDRLHEDDDH